MQGHFWGHLFGPPSVPALGAWRPDRFWALPDMTKSFIWLFVAAACSSADFPRVTERLALPQVVDNDALVKTKPAEPVPAWLPAQTPFQFVLGVDHGIRKDSGGAGHFLAPRAHGKHNGVDFLAPVGTPALAACSGKARARTRGGYGKTVQLVCKLPDALGGQLGMHISFFYAHLDKQGVGANWVHVNAGDKLGTVGKTGNAKGEEIRPHLHLETIIRDSEQGALEESHAGVNVDASRAADSFFGMLETQCLAPAQFNGKHGVRRERRVDPFVVVTCAGQPKPVLTEPEEEPLRSAFVKWSDHYTATRFDVNLGPR